MILPYFYRVPKYVALFTGYKDDIFEVISSSPVQESKFGGYIYKFGGKSFKKLNSAGFMDMYFPSLPGVVVMCRNQKKVLVVKSCKIRIR